jgi:hypothetical protein
LGTVFGHHARGESRDQIRIVECDARAELGEFRAESLDSFV